MFAETLKKVVDNLDGGLAAVIMGLDGIPVETYMKQADRVDVNTIAMEFSFILGQVRKAGDSLQVGSLEELSVKAQRLFLVCRMITPQYFVAIAMSPEGNFGKARFLARMAAPSLLAAL
ncbi:MAG: roadblock/LC7 domain-containing protein [Myxococcota bacterium]|nr:roadblock/LC7 domain-containing protein [Myxococcota bacterium]